MEIKFRGKNDDGEWADITLDFILSEEGSSIYQMFHGPYRQFTGLKDKNGKEIYEGDIIEWDDVAKSKSIIVWDDYKCCWCHTYDKEENYPLCIDCDITDKWDGTYGLVYKQHQLNVVGNIYENEELCK